MDISPKLLREVEFREQWRGYNPEEVDEFLERLALGLEELQQRLADALERASNAERRLLERSDEDEIRRTLVLAQRTAVASMDEARAEADRLVSETEARCRQLVADAEAQAARLEAEVAHRRRTELGDLAEQRAALQLDIESLQGFVDEQRSRLADALRSQLAWLEGSLALPAPPATSGIEIPPDAPPPPPAPEDAVVQAPAAEDPAVAELVEAALVPEEPFALDVDVDEPAVAVPDADQGAGAAGDELSSARRDLEDALRRAGVDPADEPGGVDPAGRPTVFDDDRLGDPTGVYDALAADGADRPVDDDSPLWRDEHDDDPFLAELRKAVVDTGPLGPRDDDPLPPAHDPAEGEDDDGSSGGFFRRRSRRG